MKLHNIPKPKGANKAPKRVGRGSGSGFGKTSGRGNKGAKARSGPGLRIGFEGGQMSLMRRLPKRGFTGFRRKVYQIVNVGSLNSFKKDSKVDRSAMIEAGILRNERLPVKVLADGKLSKSLIVTANAFSQSARKKIVDAGGAFEVTK